MEVLVKEFETFTHGTPSTKPSTSMIAFTVLIIVFLGEPNFGNSFPTRKQKITMSENKM